jgi:hypothetical protein
MARAQSQYLRIYDIEDITYQRWQNYYNGKTVQLGGQSWEHEPFHANGLGDGGQSGEEEISITVPAKTRIVRAFESALNNGRLIDISIYEFDASLDNDEPLPIQNIQGQRLIAQFTGQAIKARGNITSLELMLGSALSPIGAQVPPRKLTTAIMGKGARI